MSLLSELIAQLTALIERNREAQAEIQSASGTAEGALAVARAATVDSGNPLVVQGMTDYINGPLLGGAPGASGSGGGNEPSSRHAALAPAPATEPSRSSEPRGRASEVTRPRFAPDPGRRPSGSPTKIEGKETKRRSLEKENESARILARAGYDVEQNPPPKANGKEPDYKIQDEHWDCYAPTGNSPRTIYSQLYDKVREGQADRVVLNLI